MLFQLVNGVIGNLNFQYILPCMYGITDIVVLEILNQCNVGNCNDNIDTIPVV